MNRFDVYRTVSCSNEDLLSYHSPSYVHYMDKFNQATNPLPRFNIGVCSDVPAFEHFFEYSKLVGGSSLLGAALIEKEKYPVVLNWLGGLHHAKKEQAAGFCYVNDCVLAIEKLLFSQENSLSRH